MTEDTLTLSGAFPAVQEADWLKAVEQALKGAGPERLQRRTPEGLTIRPLYREPDFPAATDPLGQPGVAPFLRGPTMRRDPYLPWDIRQIFTTPSPSVANGEILSDLKGGVSSIELRVDPTGEAGVAVHDAAGLDAALDGVLAHVAPIALDHVDGPGLKAAALLADWAGRQAAPEAARLAFNLDPLGALARTGLLEDGIDAAHRRTAALTEALALRFPNASILRVDARPVHEAGGGDAQELAALIAHGVDLLRRLADHGLPPAFAVSRLVFTLSVDANYGLGIAKLRAARRLWARCLEAMEIEPQPMVLQAVTSARMLSRYDAWVNMLRNTGACFAAAVGGADIVTVRAFNEALGTPDALGRRIARNTQIIAMEESHLGKVADPAGGAWFTETVAEEMAHAAWREFQRIEAEGGYGASLMQDAFQARIAATRAARQADIARRKIELTGISAFPLLDGIEATPERPAPAPSTADSVTDAVLRQILPALTPGDGDASMAAPLFPVRLAEPFERLRDHAEAKTARQGRRPSIFIATLGPLAEHTARADFARGFFAAGGIASVEAEAAPESHEALARAAAASGCRLAVLCGSDARYDDEAADAARALKAAGLVRLYLAGRPGDQEAALRAAGIDTFIHVGVDVVAALELAHSELEIGA